MAEAAAAPASSPDAEAEVTPEDLSKIPFFKRLGKKQFWADVGKAIKKTAETGVQAASEGVQSLVKKDTWVGDKGAFGKDTWQPAGETMKAGFEEVKSKETWVGETGAFGKETWAGETGIFGSNNVNKAKEVVGNVFKPKEDPEIEEKKRMAMQMLKEGQISQEEYDRLMADLEASSAEASSAPAETSTEGGAAAADNRERVDTEDL